MFHGSIPSDMRRIVAEVLSGTKPQRSFVGCSGNFTVERLLWASGRTEIHSNDVTIYSSFLGWYLAGQDFRAELREPDAFPWLVEGMETKQGQVATAMLLSDMAWMLSARTRHHRRMANEFVEKWPALLAKTIERIEKLTVRLSSYSAMDVVQWLDQVDDGLLIMFPPFFAGDYKSQFSKVEAFIDWDEPFYLEMNDERKTELLDKCVEKENWIVGLHERWDELEPFLLGRTQTTNRGVPIYIYSNQRSTKRIVCPKQDLEHYPIRRLDETDEISDLIGIQDITSGQFALLRSEYMNANIRPGQPSVTYAVVVENQRGDARLAGCLAFNPSSTNSISSAWGDGPEVYMLSDFPVSSSAYPRLSKLIVGVALSVELRMKLERSFKRRMRLVATTAFTKNPVSMKYRGIMRLVTRKEQDVKDRGDHANQKYMLNYAGKAGQWSLEEWLRIWKRKHGKRDGFSTRKP